MTGGNSAGTMWDNTHSGLIDNAGLDGTREDVDGSTDGWEPGRSKCAVSQRGRGKNPFLSMKLSAPKKVLRVQLAFRTDDCCQYQGRNVKVQVGSSPKYNAFDPVCKEINQLTGSGLVDYKCDQFHVGQYVILSTVQKHLTICEAKVFVEAG